MHTVIVIFPLRHQMNRKPYLKAPDYSLPARVAAKLAWENHKKRNDSFLVELFDVCMNEVHLSVGRINKAGTNS